MPTTLQPARISPALPGLLIPYGYEPPAVDPPAPPAGAVCCCGLFYKARAVDRDQPARSTSGGVYPEMFWLADIPSRDCCVKILIAACVFSLSRRRRGQRLRRLVVPTPAPPIVSATRGLVPRKKFFRGWSYGRTSAQDRRRAIPRLRRGHTKSVPLKPQLTFRLRTMLSTAFIRLSIRLLASFDRKTYAARISIHVYIHVKLPAKLLFQVFPNP